ncbi:MAG: hypothetical protein ACKVWR_13740 [Acidimicrobiales bacterium]
MTMTTGRATPEPAAPPGLTRVSNRALERMAHELAEATPGVLGVRNATARADGERAQLELELVVDYPRSIRAVGDEVRRRVTTGLEADSGLSLDSVDVVVSELRMAGAERERRP